jgi:hypothetical protein
MMMKPIGLGICMVRASLAQGTTAAVKTFAYEPIIITHSVLFVGALGLEWKAIRSRDADDDS